LTSRHVPLVLVFMPAHLLSISLFAFLLAHHSLLVSARTEKPHNKKFRNISGNNRKDALWFRKIRP
jgi:hypothetical protein